MNMSPNVQSYVDFISSIDYDMDKNLKRSAEIQKIKDEPHAPFKLSRRDMEERDELYGKIAKAVSVPPLSRLARVRSRMR